MIGLFQSYPYLWGLLLFGVPVYLAVMLVLRAHRRSILLSSVLATPQCLSGMILIPEYWNPRRVFVFGVGPEDVLFMFLFGGFSWGAYVWIVRRTISYQTNTSRAVFRFVLQSLFFGGGYLLVMDAGVSIMYITFLLCGIWIAVLLIREPRFGIAAVTGASISVLVYTGLFLLCVLFWPEFVSQWTGTNLSGLRLGPVPLEEIVWAGLYCPAWGLTTAYILDVRLPERTGLVL